MLDVWVSPFVSGPGGWPLVVPAPGFFFGSDLCTQPSVDMGAQNCRNPMNGHSDWRMDVPAQIMARRPNRMLWPVDRVVEADDVGGEE